MGNLAKRSMTGIVYVGAIVGCIISGDIAVLILSMLFSALGVAEFSMLSEKDRIHHASFIMDIAGGMLLTFSIAMCYSSLSASTPLFLLAWLLWLLGRMIVELYIHQQNALTHLCHSIAAQIYIALPLGLLNLVNTLSWPLTMLMFILIWLNDTGAFIVGSQFGRHRLFERISPKKSWEGFWGGMFFCIAASAAVCFIYPGVFSGIMPIGCWIGYGVLVSAFATWGDLVESMIKRTLGVKDSGNILPGHGGILDRIDSLLFVIPLTFIYIVIVRSII